jgi:hypothetical protein
VRIHLAYAGTLTPANADMRDIFNGSKASFHWTQPFRNISFRETMIQGMSPTSPTIHLTEVLSSLGVSTRFSTKARARYISHFGPLNGKITVANHTIIFLDAPGIVEEDSQRAARRQSYSQWKPVSGGPIAFVQSLEKCCLSSTIYSFCI